jgi:hypothetical protein
MRVQQTKRSSSIFFTKLAGTKTQQQIEDGKSEADIRAGKPV